MSLTRGGDKGGTRSNVGGSGARAARARQAALGIQTPAKARAPTTAYVRVAVLSALLMLAVYTAVSVRRISHEASNPAVDAGTVAAARSADNLSAAADAELARVGPSLSAGGAMVQRFPANPMDAAEAALKAAPPPTMIAP